MALLKSVNDNYKGLPDAAYWTPLEWQEGLEHLNSGRPVRLTRKANAIHGADGPFKKANLEEWWAKVDRNGSDLIIMISTDQPDEVAIWQIDYFIAHQPRRWLYLYDITSNTMIRPFHRIKSTWIQLLIRHHVPRIRRFTKKLLSEEQLLQGLLSGQPPKIKDIEVIARQANIKRLPQLTTWEDALAAAGLWDDDEILLDIAYSKMTLSHFTVDSNFDRTGVLLITDKRVILIRRRLGLPGVALLSTVPMLASVKPARKAILASKWFLQYFRVPLQILRPFFTNIWAFAGGLTLTWSFINFKAIKLGFTDFSSDFISKYIVAPSIHFGFDNLLLVPYLAGIFIVLKFSFMQLFLRQSQIVVLPHDRLQHLLLDGRRLVGRWMVDGSAEINATNGIEYRINIRNYMGSSSKLARELYQTILASASDPSSSGSSVDRSD